MRTQPRLCRAVKAGVDEIERERTGRSLQQALRNTARDDLSLRHTGDVRKESADRQAMSHRRIERNQGDAAVDSWLDTLRDQADVAPPRRPAERASTRIMWVTIDALEVLFPAERQFAQFGIPSIEPAAVSGSRRRADVFVEEGQLRSTDGERVGLESRPHADQACQEPIVVITLVEERDERQSLERHERSGFGTVNTAADERERPDSAPLGKFDSAGDLTPPALQDLRCGVTAAG